MGMTVQCRADPLSTPASCHGQKLPRLAANAAFQVFWERLRADAGMDAHIVESTDPSKLNWERLRAKTIIELQRAQGAQLSDFRREPPLDGTPGGDHEASEMAPGTQVNFR